jgi:hypothetical protein
MTAMYCHRNAAMIANPVNPATLVKVPNYLLLFRHLLRLASQDSPGPDKYILDPMSDGQHRLRRHH